MSWTSSILLCRHSSKCVCAKLGIDEAIVSVVSVCESTPASSSIVPQPRHRCSHGYFLLPSMEQVSSKKNLSASYTTGTLSNRYSNLGGGHFG